MAKINKISSDYFLSVLSFNYIWIRWCWLLFLMHLVLHNYKIILKKWSEIIWLCGPISQFLVGIFVFIIHKSLVGMLSIWGRFIRLSIKLQVSFICVCFENNFNLYVNMSSSWHHTVWMNKFNCAILLKQYFHNFMDVFQ